MSASHRILYVDLDRGISSVETFFPPLAVMGGSGLAAALYVRYGKPQEAHDHPGQPLIFAIGPLTGAFPLMSKVVAAFRSPYTGEYAESHAGGRLALALRFAGFDALVIVGRAKTPSTLVVGGGKGEVIDTHYLWGMDVFSAGKLLRKISKAGPGHRSILRIGPAGERGCAYACINVDSYRHFGRLGGGAVMGGKLLKGIMVSGDSSQALPQGKEYASLYREVYAECTESSKMKKYHDLGTAVNLSALNELRALPWRNLQQTSDPGIHGISGEHFAEELLLRQTACSGCPVGCIHVGLLRERFGEEHEYLYRQVGYDYELIFALGSMLGMTDADDVFRLIEDVERMGLDVISAGVALAWATEALEKGVVSTAETLVPLSFGQVEPYRVAIEHLGMARNDFYRALGQGTLVAAREYGGEDFACVLGQEMAGYATGEHYYVAQGLGFRHSHLDSAGYTLDQEREARSPGDAAAYLLKDEQVRMGLCSMVCCLFARGVYTDERLKACLHAYGHPDWAEDFEAATRRIQAMRWALKFQSGFDPEKVSLPKRYTEVVNWKGSLDQQRYAALRSAYLEGVQVLRAEGEAAIKVFAETASGKEA